MPTAFETFVNDELPNRVASTEASQTANSIPRYTGTAKLTEERTPAQVLSDIGGAAAAHPHVEADITDLTHYSHPNHTGDVTSTGDGATVIAPNKVTLAMMADMATASLLGRITAATGDPEVLSKASALSLLNAEDGATADQTDAEIETAYNNRVSIVSQAAAEAGTSTTRRGWTAQRVQQATAALESATPTIPKWHRSLFIPNPVLTDAFPVLYFPAAATITRIHAERSGGTSVTFNFEERAEGSYFASGSDIWTSGGDKVVTADATYTSFDNASMAANSILTYAASAVSGGVTDLIVTIEGTWD